MRVSNAHPKWYKYACSQEHLKNWYDVHTCIKGMPELGVLPTPSQIILKKYFHKVKHRMEGLMHQQQQESVPLVASLDQEITLLIATIHQNSHHLRPRCKYNVIVNVMRATVC